MGDSILPQPELRVPIEFVQGGGGDTSTSSIVTNVRAMANDATVSNISNVQLKTLTNDLVVRYVTPAIKDDIMNLTFIEGEQTLFDEHLKFNNPFIKRFISNSSIGDKNQLDIAPGSSPKEKFYEFWKIYINEDGTDGFHRMTGKNANYMREYLDEIRKAHEQYLLKGALRYLQRGENPAAFDQLYELPKKTIFDMFFEVIDVPINSKPEQIPVPIKSGEKGDTFSKYIIEIKNNEAIAMDSFTKIKTAYLACINIIESDVKYDFKQINTFLKSIVEYTNKIVNTLIEVEGRIGESKRSIIELERKLIDNSDESVSHEIESTKKFIEESNKYMNSIQKYRNAAVLAGNVIKPFSTNGGNTSKNAKNAKKQLLNDLKKEYNYSVGLIYKTGGVDENELDKVQVHTGGVRRISQRPRKTRRYKKPI